MFAIWFLFACEGEVDDKTSSSDPVEGLEEALPAPPAPSIILHTSPPVEELAAQAVEKVPAWLRNDLMLSFRKINPDLQNELAALIIDLENPYLVDEIAFSIAHLNPELLEHSDFYPQLLLENAEMIYERDPLLHYVELIEQGSPGTDEDYYTTARYRIENSDGEIVEKTIDKEIYYWYLVHPRMEDEYPFYIDPWSSCGSAECPSDPENGMFWRDFLWQGAQDNCPPEREDCPVIHDYVVDEEVDVMWKSKAYDSQDNGAIGRLIQWEKASMTFGAGDERPIQPNRIYAVGCGNCGEWADMATAAARSALIPSHNVGARANDHTWNEFWDDGWMQWEPVNNYVLHYTYYQTSEGETKSNAVYAITAGRGDGHISTERTIDYGNTFELNLRVLDAAGNPVDGARVVLYGPILVYPEYADYWWYAAESYSGPDGVAHFVLGENNTYAYRVDSPIGSYPTDPDQIVPFLEDTLAGEDHSQDITIQNAYRPILDLLAIPEDAEPESDSTLEVNLSYESRLSADSYMLRGTFSEPVASGKLVRFVVDANNYAAYVAGETYTAHAVKDIETSDSFSLPLPLDQEWYLVLSNDQSVGISAVGSVSATMEPTGETTWTGESMMEGGFYLLPGEHVAYKINGAE